MNAFQIDDSDYVMKLELTERGKAEKTVHEIDLFVFNDQWAEHGEKYQAENGIKLASLLESRVGDYYEECKKFCRKFLGSETLSCAASHTIICEVQSRFLAAKKKENSTQYSQQSTALQSSV